MADILSNFAEVVTRESESIISRYMEAHDVEFETLDSKRTDVIEARQIDKADGQELDRIGAIFGELGKRRGRNDNTYRAYLKSIVDAFNGRGSIDGLKFAVASAIGGTKDNVRVVEDFENLTYTVEIVNLDTQFITEAVNDLAELADPSAVDLDEAIILTDGEELLLDPGDSALTSSSTGLGGGTLNMDGTSTLG